MRVFVVGASGAIGSRLVPQLIERGHEVIGSARSPDKAERLRGLGAEAVVLDALDARAVREAVAAARPDAIVHQATALTGLSDFKHFDRSFAQTNRLRTEGTNNLLAAAREAGVGRFVAQSYANYALRPRGRPGQERGRPARYEAGRRRRARPSRRWTTSTRPSPARVGLRSVTASSTATPTTGWSRPCVRASSRSSATARGVWSFIHLDDAAAATVLALEHDGPAIYNIVDDEPSPTREWLPELARIIGAKPPRHFPRLARPAVRGRGAGDDGDRVARRVERQGQARARLDAALPKLAARLRRPVRETDRRNLCAAIGSGQCRTGRVELAMTRNGIQTHGSSRPTRSPGSADRG